MTKYELLEDVVVDDAANAFTLLYSGTNAQSGSCTVALASDTITVVRDNVEGITVEYDGTGTSTLTKSGNNITITRANVEGMNIGYDGTGTCTIALAGTTITTTRAAINACVLTYTGDLVATVAVDTSANTLTLTIDGTPTVHDLTGGTKDTLAKIIAILDAVDDVTCTLATGAVGTAPSEKLDTLTTFTLVKDTAKTLTYTPANTTIDISAGATDTLTEIVAALDATQGVTCTLATGAVGATAGSKLAEFTAKTISTTPYVALYTPDDDVLDVTQAANNTLTKLEVVMDALPGITCSLADGALASQASSTLKDFTAQTISTAAYTMLYTPADATWDCAAAANNTVDKLIALFNATTYLVATKSSGCYGSTDSLSLVPFSAQNIASTAYQITYSAGNIESTAFVNIGQPIPVYGWDSATFFVTVDINDSTDVNLRLLALSAIDGTPHLLNHDDILYVDATVSATKDCIELDTDADQSVVIVLPNLYGIQYIQLQAMADTVGATPGQIDKVDVMLRKDD